MPVAPSSPVSLLHRPKWRPHFRLEIVPGEGVFILSATEQIVLQGSLYELVAPLLDGREAEEICWQLREQVPPAKVFYTIRKLTQRGLLFDAEAESNLPAASLWSSQGMDLAEARRRLAETTVALKAIGVEIEDLRALLESLSVRVADEGDLTVLVVDHVLRKELGEVNRQALRDGKRWLLVKPIGREIWIGPLFQPGRTGCWECLAHRLRCNLPVLGFLEGLLGERDGPPVDAAVSPATLSMAWGMAANTVASWIAAGGKLPSVEGKIVSFDVTTCTSGSHVLVQQPHCPECGQQLPTQRGDTQPLVLQSRRKVYTDDGGHRCLSPEETIARYAHHVSPICGALTMLKRSAPENDGVMHVYVSGANVARGPQTRLGLKHDLRESSCGKGTSDLQAKVSALCEGLERYSGLFRGDEPRRRARMAELGDKALHPNDCMLFSPRQYARRNAETPVYNYVPLPFDPERTIDWTPVWSLTRQTVRYLPTAYCYFDYPHDGDADFCVGCSNGNAAGNNLEEAILQGFFELVERDSVGIWWYNRLRLPGVDLDSFDVPYLGRLQACLAKHERELWALDLTTDLQIPAFAALSRRRNAAAEQILFGFGAHLDPKIALLRAVTELNQMLLPLLGRRDENLPPVFAEGHVADWLQGATLEAHPYLSPGEEPLRTLRDYPQAWTDDLLEDIRLCQSRVEQNGLELLVLDQTRPEISMPVVKVFVPGLRHFWARFAPGRLYDVPVKLGWLAKPASEEQLNPSPMFL